MMVLWILEAGLTLTEVMLQCCSTEWTAYEMSVEQVIEELYIGKETGLEWSFWPDIMKPLLPMSKRHLTAASILRPTYLGSRISASDRPAVTSKLLSWLLGKVESSGE